jgi:ketosteroid isomerase-like protein
MERMDTGRAMSQELVERLHKGYDAFSTTKQINPHFLAPDVVLIQPDDVLGEGVCHGREAFVRNARKWTETWDDFRNEPEEFFDLGGDQVMVFVRLRGRAHGSGVPLDQPVAHVWTLHGREVKQLRLYPNRAEALEAVGLRE